MKILVTSSRMPFALDQIRKLGQAGHQVFASDTFRTSPGSHSRYATGRLTAEPRYDTRRFIADVAQILRHDAIDLLVPSFEEVFYLAYNHEALPPGAVLFAAPFETLARLHDKARLIELAEELRIPAPRTMLARSQDELREAIGELPEYMARPAYSRGGVRLLTNTGPLAGAVALEECEPTADNPFLVQPFVRGKEVCTFSVAHQGRLTAHATYLHPREIEHAGGIVFESIHDDETLGHVQRIVEALDYTGQISFDFLRTETGLQIVECNPRPTAGVYMLSAKDFSDALLDLHPRRLRLAAPGIRSKISVALLRDAVMHFDEAVEDFRHLLSRGRDVYVDRHDLLPALYQFLSYSHVIDYRRRNVESGQSRTDLMAAYFYDICWNGEEIERIPPLAGQDPQRGAA